MEPFCPLGHTCESSTRSFQSDYPRPGDTFESTSTSLQSDQSRRGSICEEPLWCIYDTGFQWADGNQCLPGEYPAVRMDVEKEKETHSYLSKEEIKEKVHKYNLAVTDKLKMTLASTALHQLFEAHTEWAYRTEKA
ncbi:hypothetical protein P7K49_019558 [Saguinus oedipus]|uniref:Uncharacterized protein n=1 Tax=Saguinus oedipus TaxID=9490 RepID=A0ABQ9UXP6_SAGOE|nr:hypothetical protein P7K49_019558 [Saguinus oedipus]